MQRRDAEYVDYFTARFDWARRVAFALCGDWVEAEELAQSAFVRIYGRWGRIRDNTVDAYLRTVLTRLFLDGRRRRRARERPVAELPELPVEAGFGAVEERSALVAALQQVTPKQRAVLVLRYVDDLSVEQTAAVMRCSVSAVKSQTSRGLAALRRAYGQDRNQARDGLETRKVS